MDKVSKVVWGIIGAGDVCEVKSAPAMSKIQNSEVKTVMRRNAEKVADFAKRHHIKNHTTNVDDIFSDKEINAVYIATPPDSHAELTIKAAQAGKAVYVEKPMARTTEECREMIDACKKADVPLFVAYYRRALPGFLKVKELVGSGKIGEIRTVTIEMYQKLSASDTATTNWRVLPDISGGGYFHDLASHQLDYLDFLFGEITDCHGISGNQAGLYPADDIVSAVFRFKNGVTGIGNWCFSTSAISEKDKITLIGSKGEISFNCFGTPMQIIIKPENGDNEVMEYTHAKPIQEPLVQLIVDELRGKGMSPSKGENGLRATAVLSEITKKL